MLIRDYDFIHNIDVLFEKKIVIYGAGAFGSRIAYFLMDTGVDFDCFCDKDESRKKFLNHPVITLDELKSKTCLEDCMIIVSSKNYCEEMIRVLETKKIEAYVCTWYGLQAGIELHVEDERFELMFRKDFVQRKKTWISWNKTFWYTKMCTFPHAILVYQPGKVGSKTVWQTLREERIDAVHVHSLLPETGVEVMDKMLTTFSDTFKVRGGRIITLVREPIARALSQFMQYFDTFIMLEDIEDQDIATRASNWMREELLDTNQEFMWFDREIKEVTGIDIFQYPFDKERGYAWIKEGNIEILVLKMEKLNENTAVIGEFVGKPNLELRNSNVGDGKHYNYIYKELKEKIRIPASLLDSQFKDNWQLDHFYSEEEKKRFREKWSKYIEAEK